MKRVTTVAELRAQVRALRAADRRVVLVATMGALHAGHLALVEHAAADGDAVVVSVFVNPAQFDRPDDLAAYPQDLAGDEAALSGLGPAAPDVVFAPDVTEVYGPGQLTTVHVAELTEGLCGAGREGHFDGVATVVTKLLNMVRPDAAVFGRKDYQQLVMIRRLVVDLHLDVEILDAPTVREADGVALSSRNRRLDADGRRRARVLSRALGAAVRAASPGHVRADVVDAGAARQAALATLAAEPGVRVEYLEVVDPETLTPLDDDSDLRRVLVAGAVHVGGVRLIDNVVIGVADDEHRLLTAVGDLPVPQAGD